MTSLSTATALLLWLATQAPATPPAAKAEPPPATPPPSLEVTHVPVAQVPVGRELVLEAEVTPAFRLAALVAHHRNAGEAEFREVTFTLTEEGRYAAILPVPPGQHTPVEYYLTARDTDGQESVPFASAELPHTVLIQVPERELEREALLVLYDQRRSRVSLFSEYVDFGPSRAGTVRYLDRYYRLEADYLHRLLTDVGGIRISSIRIGVGHLRARVPPEQTATPLDPAPTVRTGLDYGFSELDVALSAHFGFTTRLVLGGNAEGFAAGLGGKMRIGRERGAHVELGVETTSGLGTIGTVRLAWDTVKRVPMSAAVQMTNFPAGPSGVRLLYHAQYEFSPALTVGALVGYQARISISGGPTLGLTSSYAW